MNITEKTAASEPEVGLKVSIVDLEEGLAQKPKLKCPLFKRIASILQRSFRLPDRSAEAQESPWLKLFTRALYLLGSAIILAVVAVVFVNHSHSLALLTTYCRIYHSLLFDLVRRLSPPKLHNTGLQQIVNSWVEPGTVTPALPSWLPNFSRDIQPKAIHSHNDYWRPVPLFEALSLGITGVEADCHLINGEVYIGHSNSSLRPHLTLRSLYLDPLTSILENQNPANPLAPSSGINGVWDVDATKGIVLMTDLKTEGFSTLDAVQQQLEPFRKRGWLTYWNGTGIVPGPILHVGTGNTPFEAVLNSSYANATYRDVFFDAPLDRLSAIYNVSNSYYTSTSITGLFGGKANIPHAGLSKRQMGVLKSQIDQAASLGLVSRYWDIPTWPVNRRVHIWNQLEGLGIGMLNADAIAEAARWNWKWCNVLGLELC